MRRRQLVYIFKEGFGSRGVLKSQIILKCRCVELLYKVRVLKEALYFGTEHNSSVHIGIIHGLYSEEIPCAEKLLFVFVPYNK